MTLTQLRNAHRMVRWCYSLMMTSVVLSVCSNNQENDEPYKLIRHKSLDFLKKIVLWEGRRFFN
jgi:hypothetical protein